MKKRMIFLFSIVPLLFNNFISVFGQSSSGQVRLNWQVTSKKNNISAKAGYFLSFEQSVSVPEAPGLPALIVTSPLQQDVPFTVQLSHELMENTPDSLLGDAAKSLPSSFYIRCFTTYTDHRAYANFVLVPVQRDPLTGQIEKLLSFSYKIIPEALAPTGTPVAMEGAGRPHNKNDVTTSALASGSWFKLGVTEPGVYKLDYSFLTGMSAEFKNTDISKIRVFGKAGGMLPQANDVPRDKDLTENAVMVEDNGQKGIFDQGDYLYFYAAGPVSWVYNKGTGEFNHRTNFYSDTAYYFVSLGGIAGKRVTDISSDQGASVNNVSQGNVYALHELEALTTVMKTLKSGRNWFGEEFRSLTEMSVNQAISLDLPDLHPGSPVRLRTGVVARSAQPSTFTFSINGSNIGSIQTAAANIDDPDSPYGDEQISGFSFTPSGSHMNIGINFQKRTSEATGWLDFIELNGRADLKYTPGRQAGFRYADSIRKGLVNKYYIQPGMDASGMMVWETTDFHNVRNISLADEGGFKVFLRRADTLREFIIFDKAGLMKPVAFGKVANQNLHGLEQPDMVIVAYPALWPAAQSLADFHRSHDNFIVHVVTPAQLYNEFSSGTQDISAIRDFMKMFYDRSVTLGRSPRYLLLMGGASYDYKWHLANNTNQVPSYESPESLDPIYSFCSDDYFGFLDDKEGEWEDWTIDETLDIGIGRIPATTLEQASGVVEKIKRYHDKQAMQSWRNSLTFIADDQNADIHLDQTEDLDMTLWKNYPEYNLSKIYFDAYKQITASSGARYPDVTNEINKKMKTGTLIMNYVGHGGEVGWAHERVLEIQDINNWTNTYTMPLLITATCEFSRFDDPERVSAGELALLNPKGGAIGLYTTTRVVNSGGNATLNRNILLNNLFDKTNPDSRLGDAFRVAKNRSLFNVNTRNFSLLGDPAVRLAIPRYKVVATSMNQKPLGPGADTLKALSLVTITGEVQDGGKTISDFNGYVYPTVYDKPTLRKTLSNDMVPNNPDESSPARYFKVQENIIYKGKITAKDGRFSFSFIVPKDISFMVGSGKISFYAEDGVRDANGYDTSIKVGSVASDIVPDLQAPTVELYMNDTNFRRGGLVSENPVLLARVKDNFGINTTGSGVGHDLTAVLNDDTNQPIILNEYYEASLNSYKEGIIRYPFFRLPDGNYSLKVKVWDVANNSAEATTDFTVAASTKLALAKIFNYPNPFSSLTGTTIQFEHNRPNEKLDIRISIFSISGQYVRELHGDANTEGDRVTKMTWNGRDMDGAEVKSGIYVYNIMVTAQDGQVVQQSQRLVVIK